MNAIELRQKMFKRLPDLETKGLTEVPNQKFWDYYHINKESLNEANILVTKSDDNIWYIIDNESNEQALLDKLIKKHSPECERCGKHRELVRKAAKDDTIQYFWNCIDCNKMSGAIPRKLAEYLKNGGQAVRDIEELPKEHPPGCQYCAGHCELVRRAAKDDTIQYFWNCIDCDRMSGPISPKFAEHLIKNRQAVRDIE